MASIRVLARRLIFAISCKLADRGARSLLLLLALFACGALVFVGDTGKVKARQYSVFSDTSKPVLPYLLSDPKNVGEMQKKFGLSNAKKEKILAAIRQENESLAKAYGKSERLIQENRKLPLVKVQSKIAGSGYNSQVRQVVIRTRKKVLSILPASKRPEFKAWVNSKWNQAARQNPGNTPNSTYQVQSANSKGVTYYVYATQYNGYTRFEVALPHVKLKRDGGFRVRLGRNGHHTWAPVKEVGPWNTRDNYWQSRRYRSMWRNLPQGISEARAAYFHNYHRGKDQFGRNVLNPASIDLTPAVARRLGLKKYQNAKIHVFFPWVGR